PCSVLPEKTPGSLDRLRYVLVRIALQSVDHRHQGALPGKVVGTFYESDYTEAADERVVAPCESLHARQEPRPHLEKPATDAADLVYKLPVVDVEREAPEEVEVEAGNYADIGVDEVEGDEPFFSPPRRPQCLRKASNLRFGNVRVAVEPGRGDLSERGP